MTANEFVKLLDESNAKTASDVVALGSLCLNELASHGNHRLFMCDDQNLWVFMYHNCVMVDTVSKTIWERRYDIP